MARPRNARTDAASRGIDDEEEVYVSSPQGLMRIVSHMIGGILRLVW